MRPSETERDRAWLNDLQQLAAIGGASELCAASWVKAGTTLAIRGAVAAVLHVEAEHSGGRRLLRGAGVHFVPAFGLPFQTKTPLDSLTYRGARDTWTHTPVCTNAHSPPRAWGGDAAASVRVRVGTAWAVCSVPLRTAAAPSGIASRATVTRAAGGRRPQFQRWHTLRLYGTRHMRLMPHARFFT